MKKNNKECMICGNRYTFCLNCGTYDKLPRWMAMFDEEICRSVFYIISDYKAGIITKNEAKNKLIEIKATSLKFVPLVQRAIDEIMSISKSELNKVENTIEEVENLEKKANVKFSYFFQDKKNKK